jgi:hypothetical protein
VMLGLKPRALPILGKCSVVECSTTEHLPFSTLEVLFITCPFFECAVM